MSLSILFYFQSNTLFFTLKNNIISMFFLPLLFNYFLVIFYYLYISPHIKEVLTKKILKYSGTVLRCIYIIIFSFFVTYIEKFRKISLLDNLFWKNITLKKGLHTCSPYYFLVQLFSFFFINEENKRREGRQHSKLFVKKIT